MVPRDPSFQKLPAFCSHVNCAGAQPRASKHQPEYAHAEPQALAAKLDGADIMPGTINQLINLPAEILLYIIESLPLDRQTIQELQLTHPTICGLVRKYENSVTINHSKSYMRQATTDFPWDGSSGYKWLFRTIDRYDVCDSVMVVLTSPFVCHTVQPFNQCVILTGLYLLYRLCDIEDPSAKLEYINGLQRDPLTAILLVIWHSTLVARYHGLGCINSSTYMHEHGQLDANQLELRNEIEHSFSEAVMEHGPQFIYGILGYDGAAETTLLLSYHEHANQDWAEPTHLQDTFIPLVTEGPHRKPAEAEAETATLYNAVLSRMATIMQCERADVMDHIVERSEETDHSLANLSMEGKRALLQGLDLEFEA